MIIDYRILNRLFGLDNCSLGFSDTCAMASFLVGTEFVDRSVNFDCFNICPY